MMVDVDPDFCRANRGERSSKPILNCRVECDGNIDINGRGGGLGQQFGARQEGILFEHAVFIPDTNVLAKLLKRESERELAAERVTVRANVTQNREALIAAQDLADFFERGVAHSSSLRGFSISRRISRTRAPRSMESSRWKTRCGVYFKTTWRESSACRAGRCASSLSITLAPSAGPRMLTNTWALFRSGVTSTALTLTSTPSKFISRAMIALSSRFTSSFTRSCRCFMAKPS